MSKYKVGDKIVLTISDVNEKVYYPHYEFNNNNSNLWISSTDKYSEPLSAYIEQARAKGQNEAWELARKIILPPSKGGMSSDDYIAIFGSCISEAYLMKNYTYSEASAKVAEWEEGKEEIKVGDVVKHNETEYTGIVTRVSEHMDKITIIFKDGSSESYDSSMFHKTGRHIDIDGFLNQIGGEE